MDSMDDSKSFFKHVFNFDDDSKSEILNIIQYSIIALIPIIILNKSMSNYVTTDTILEDIKDIENKWQDINNYMNNVKSTLDGAVHGHDKAKIQIERIIAQWINGEQGGYSFGFEGPPGCGKTTFANKGLAKCLVDENGETRPFSFIAMGGQDNGSTLNGHNYTYVGSEWGKFTDILIKNKDRNAFNTMVMKNYDIVAIDHGRQGIFNESLTLKAVNIFEKIIGKNHASNREYNKVLNDIDLKNIKLKLDSKLFTLEEIILQLENLKSQITINTNITNDLPQDFFKPIGDKVPNDWENDYTILNTSKWQVPMPRPPVCINNSPCRVCPTDSSNYINLQQWDDARYVLQKPQN